MKTNTVKKARKTVLASIAMVIAASLAISSGMAAPAMAKPQQFDEKGDSPLPDFDIKQYFIDDDGALNIQLYGKAGRTLPEGMTSVYAYVVFTNDGIYATDSHEAQHAESEGETTANKAWHGHKVEIAVGGGPNGRDCLIEIGALDAESRMAGSNVKIIGASATEIDMVVTTELILLVEDPDNVPEGECVAEVAEEPFDVASGL
jgi:hypothetical protein